MGRGPKKHMKRIAAPKSWMLDKLSGKFAPRPSPGPHKLRSCLPLILLVRNKLHFATNSSEVKKILKARNLSVDNKIRTDPNFPLGLMDVITFNKIKKSFRILYDAKGRFIAHKIDDNEAKYKLLKIKKIYQGKAGIPHSLSHDGRTIRYQSPKIKPNDTIKYNLETNEIEDIVKFEIGAVAIVTGGHSIGRVGTILSRKRHLGGFDIIQLRDNRGEMFATKIDNVFVIGTAEKLLISLPKTQGIRYNITEERNMKLKDDPIEEFVVKSLEVNN